MKARIDSQEDRVIVTVAFGLWRRLGLVLAGAVLLAVPGAKLTFLWDAGLSRLADMRSPVFWLVCAVFGLTGLGALAQGLFDGDEVWDFGPERIERRRAIAWIVRRKHWGTSRISALNLGSVGFGGNHLFLILVVTGGPNIHLPRMRLAECRRLFDALKDLYPQAEHETLAQSFEAGIAARLKELKKRP